jgi:plasmid stabilization system protein ParE
MKRYAVIFEDSAQADVLESYDWGCRIWGKREAQQWLRQLRTAVSKQLRVIPKVFPSRLKTTSSPKRFVKWLWAVIACCLR